MSALKVLAVTGTSGGHIFPAQAFLEELKKEIPESEVLLIQPQKKSVTKQESLENGYKINYVYMPTVAWLKISLENIRKLIFLCKGSLKSIRLLINFKPDVVIGFGSFPTVPVVLCAWFIRIKTVIHEQNVIPGRANSFLALFVDKIALSFKETVSYLSNFTSKTVITGNPLRSSLLELEKFHARSFLGLSPNKFTIFIMGGSSGSRNINAVSIEAFGAMSDRSTFQVIHLCGERDLDFLSARYRQLNIECKVYSFFDQMQYAYSASDMVVSRAGATSVTEIMFYHLPAIMIPYPYAYEHQMKNAEILRDCGLGVIIKEEEIDSVVLKDYFCKFFSRNFKLAPIGQELVCEKLQSASGLLVKEVLSV